MKNKCNQLKKKFSSRFQNNSLKKQKFFNINSNLQIQMKLKYYLKYIYHFNVAQINIISSLNVPIPN